MNIRVITKYIYIFVMLLLLNACGDQCFNDITFPSDGGAPYVEKMEQVNVSSASSTFVSTFEEIPEGSDVTISITGGPIFLCGDDSAKSGLGPVAVSANNQGWTQLLGPSFVVKDATAVGDSVVFTVGCNPNDKTTNCYNLPCDPTTQQGCSCKDGSGNSCTPPSTGCQCTSQEQTCANAQYYNEASCIKKYSSGSGYSPNLNQWNWVSNLGQVNNFCTSINYDEAFVSRGNDWTQYYPYLYKYINDGKNQDASAQCWYTAGMGMVLKIITDEGATGCNDPGDITWFINNPLSKEEIQNNPDKVTQDDDFTLIRCPGSSNVGFQDCIANLYSTVVQRIIHKTQNAKFYCAMFIDQPGTYSDNFGGYEIGINVKRCIASGGNPIQNLTSGANPSLGGLQYKTSNTGTPDLVVNIPNKGLDKNNVMSYAIKNFPQSSQLFFRVSDFSGAYGDNVGEYIVNVSWREVVAGTQLISKVIQDLRDNMRHIVFDKMPQYYCSSTCPPNTQCNNDQGVCKSPYIKYIKALLVFYIMSYGFAFIMGFVNISAKDLIIRVVKIGLVLQLISEGSWDFFNNTLFKLFVDGTDQLIHLATFTSCGGPGQLDCPPVFSFVDKMFDLLFLDKAIWLKILSILFISPVGLILGVLLIIGMFYFIIGILSAVSEYLMSVIAVAVLLLLGPIFIPFILFAQTRSMFDQWISMLFRYSMEPVFLVIGLSFLFEIYFSIFREMFQFNACWKCMWGIEFPSSFDDAINSLFKLGQGESFLCFQGFGPWGMAPSGGGSIIASLGVDTSGLLLLIILSAVVRNYTQFVSNVMTQLIGARASVWKMTGGQRQEFKSPGEAVMHGLGISKFEKGAEKVFRSGAYRALGIKTEKDKEKELDQYEESLINKKTSGTPGSRGGSGSASSQLGGGTSSPPTTNKQVKKTATPSTPSSTNDKRTKGRGAPGGGGGTTAAQSSAKATTGGVQQGGASRPGINVPQNKNTGDTDEEGDE